MKLNLIVLMISSFMLTACVSKETCDPSIDSNVFNKLGCSVTGTYQERLSEKEQNLLALEEERDRLALINEELNKDREIISNDLKKRQKSLSALKQKIAKLKSDLAAKEALNAKLKGDFAKVEKELKEIESLPKNSSTLELEQKKEDLARELNTLMSNM